MVYGLIETIMSTIMMDVALTTPVMNEQRLQIFKYNFIVCKEILQRDIRIQCKNTFTSKWFLAVILKVIYKFLKHYRILELRVEIFFHQNFQIFMVINFSKVEAILLHQPNIPRKKADIQVAWRVFEGEEL